MNSLKMLFNRAGAKKVNELAYFIDFRFKVEGSYSIGFKIFLIRLCIDA